ncbi:MAG: hypothetical protein Q7U91_04535 [Sideroxyarcus sp.]|nr:hypothetical protein [Sideroxyarcus sp.]
MIEHDDVVVAFPKRKKSDGTLRRLQALISLSIAVLCAVALAALLSGCHGMHHGHHRHHGSGSYGTQEVEPAEEAPTKRKREYDNTVRSAEAGQGIRLGGLRFLAPGAAPGWSK